MDRRGGSEREGGPGGGGESTDSGDNRTVPEDPDSPNTRRSLLRAILTVPNPLSVKVCWLRER